MWRDVRSISYTGFGLTFYVRLQYNRVESARNGIQRKDRDKRLKSTPALIMMANLELYFMYKVISDIIFETFF